MTISNLQLSVIMSAYCGNDMYCSGYSDTPTLREQTAALLDANIIRTKTANELKEGGCFNFAITDKGRFYLDHLLSTPFPIEEKSWVIPN